MEWVGHSTTCVVRFFSMGGDFDSLRRDARSRFRVRARPSIRRSVRRSVDRTRRVVRARKPSAVGKSRDATPRTDDRSGPIERARIGTRSFEGDAKRLAETNERMNERMNDRSDGTNDAVHRDALATPLRRPSVVRSVPNQQHSTPIQHRFETRRSARERFRNGTRRSMLFFGRDLVCDFDESRFVKSVPPILGISSRIWFLIFRIQRRWEKKRWGILLDSIFLNFDDWGFIYYTMGNLDD